MDYNPFTTDQSMSPFFQGGRTPQQADPLGMSNGLADIMDPLRLFAGAGVPRQVGSYAADQSASQIPGYDNFQQQMWAREHQAAARQAPQLGPAAQYGGAQIDTSQQAQFRNYQNALSQQLMAQATGQGPSLAQMQLQRATDQNMAQAMALGQSQHGMGGGGAMRAIANQRAQIGQQQASDSGMLRLQEQQGAQGLLGQISGNARAQDIGLAGQQAGFYQQAGLANMGAQNQFAMQNQAAQMNQRQMNDQAVQFYISHGMSMAEAQQRANFDMQKLNQENFWNHEQLTQKAQQEAQANKYGILSGIGNMLTTIL